MAKSAIAFLLIMTVGFSSKLVIGVEGPAPVPLIFDTDVGNDIDDALALGVIHALRSRHECRLLAVTINKDEPSCAPFVDLVNTFYGEAAVPVGLVRNGKTPEASRYTGPVVEARDNGRLRYPRDLASGRDAPDAVELLRETLAGQPNGSVVIVAVGFSTNLARLLDSPADDRIKQTGLELVAAKCRLLSMMAGQFGGNERRPEYNVVTDLPSASSVFARWPTPIVASGFEIGTAVLFPGRSIESDFGYVDHHPLCDAYRAYDRMPYDRPTWDLTSVLYAVRPDRGYFGLSQPGVIEVDDKGVTSFRPRPDGKHRYLTIDREQIERTREALVLLASQPPDKK
ncbi:MAG TPA: nucleoside hydrolase [Pirellulales bacterium]|jgi:inosine-uridine nucleoside N-ribohydrolase|nr:nucleoside hydrolase [Pirellulales bacterium]